MKLLWQKYSEMNTRLVQKLVEIGKMNEELTPRECI